MEQGPNKDIGEPVSKRWNHLYTGQFLWKNIPENLSRCSFSKLKLEQ